MIYLTHCCFYWEAEWQNSSECEKQKEIWCISLPMFESYIKSRRYWFIKLFSHIVSADCRVKGGIPATHIVKKHLKKLIMFWTVSGLITTVSRYKKIIAAKNVWQEKAYLGISREIWQIYWGEYKLGYCLKEREEG